MNPEAPVTSILTNPSEQLGRLSWQLSYCFQGFSAISTLGEEYMRIRSHQILRMRAHHKDDFSPLDVCFYRPDRALHDQADTHGHGQMHDDIGSVHQFSHKQPIHDRVQDVFKSQAAFQVLNVLDASCRKLVDDTNLLPLT